MQLYDEGPIWLSVAHCNGHVFLETVIYVSMGTTGKRPIQLFRPLQSEDGVVLFKSNVYLPTVHHVSTIDSSSP